jgi:hypothetical protein
MGILVDLLVERVVVDVAVAGDGHPLPLVDAQAINLDI